VDFVGKEREDGEKWGIRNAKLRTSRKVLFAAGLVPLLQTHRFGREERREYLAAQLAAPATDRLASAFLDCGARDAGVLNYTDLALAGAYSDLQEFYRHGLTQLDAYSRKTHNAAFTRLSAAQQDEIITALEAGKADGFAWPTAREFFNTLRTHTMEGMFADPVYGGNKDFAGWRLVGFPGAQPQFTQPEMQSKAAYKGGSIVGLQATRKV